MNASKSSRKSTYATCWGFLMRLIATGYPPSSRPSWPIAYHGTCFPAVQKAAKSICFPISNLGCEGREFFLSPFILGLYICMTGRVGCHARGLQLLVIIILKFPMIASKPTEFITMVMKEVMVVDGAKKRINNIQASGMEMTKHKVICQ